MPMAFGTRRPAILIPAVADTWPDDRRRAVMLHELAHVARYDCLTQSLAFAACTIYWFHPGRVVGCAAPAHRARARLRRPRDRGRRRAARVCRPSARDRVCVRQPPGAGARGQHGASTSARRPHACRARRRAQPARALVARARRRRRRSRPCCCFRWPAPRATVVAADPDGDRAPAIAAAGNGSAAGPGARLAFEGRSGRTRETVHRRRACGRGCVGLPQDGLPGTWEIRPTSSEGTVHLRLVELNSSSGSNVPIELLEGLTAAQLAGAGGPVQFRMRRDAGTFTFEGVFRSGVGAGTFSFTPDPNFAAELAKRGFARPTAREQYQLARHDVGFAFLDELTKQGYAKPQTSELVRAGQHGVQAAYLREMGALGYRLGSLEPLITAQGSRVTPAYVRELADAGLQGPAGRRSAPRARSRRHSGVRAGDARRRLRLAHDGAVDQRAGPRRQRRSSCASSARPATANCRSRS